MMSAKRSVKCELTVTVNSCDECREHLGVPDSKYLMCSTEAKDYSKKFKSQQNASIIRSGG